MYDLAGQVALITGSNRGLGLAIAEELHNAGAKIVINYKRQESQSQAQEIVNRLGCCAVQGDVTDPALARGLFIEANRHYGKPVTIVVNNALGGEFKFNGDARSKLEDIEWSEFDAQLQTTLRGALNMTKVAIAGFKELGMGRIINIGTNLVQNPVVPYHDYTSSKGALLAFTHTTAAELGPLNVTCNMVSGGLLDATDASSATPKEVFDQVAAVTPLRKVTTPKDLAGAVVFLASPYAKAITGQQITVDGGLCMS